MLNAKNIRFTADYYTLLFLLHHQPSHTDGRQTTEWTAEHRNNDEKKTRHAADMLKQQDYDVYLGLPIKHYAPTMFIFQTGVQ